MAAVLGEAELFLGSDAGPAHLAAAVGTRAVVLFGAALPAQWAPLGEGHTVLRPAMPCAACVSPELCRPPDPYHMYCVRRIPASEVSGAVDRVLATPPGEAGHA
jgi:ADP-heptose:LPS heptosyltransferase